MKEATKIESGVITTTRMVILTSMVSIITSVPIMVMSPVKNCVKPSSSPSEN